MDENAWTMTFLQTLSRHYKMAAEWLEMARKCLDLRFRTHLDKKEGKLSAILFFLPSTATRNLEIADYYCCSFYPDKLR